jgi:A/G-specific adenine glycosylase
MAPKQPSLNKKEREFIEVVWKYYRAYGRHTLPWRKTIDPYKILVSEIMLQQTQVSRVIPKYKEFLKAFKTAKLLAEAPLGDVLKSWQGLGYNRRAKFLWSAAQSIVHLHDGKWPQTFAGLRTLPGIGDYTAGAVMSFAYNKPHPLIETNVRTVYIHHFFKDVEGVSDKDLLPIIERTLDRKNPREWSWALMDYGAYLKATVGNLNKKSKTYQKQSSFKESNRYVRGAIVRALVEGGMTKQSLLKTLSDIDRERIVTQLEALMKEELVEKVGRFYTLP